MHNYATDIRIRAQPIVCEVLNFFDTWRSERDLLAAKGSVDADALHLLLSLLVRRSMLHTRPAHANDRERLMDGWGDWNPAAGFFHQSTKDLEYADLDTIERLTAKKSRLRPMPATRDAGGSSACMPRRCRPGSASAR